MSHGRKAFGPSRKQARDLHHMKKMKKNHTGTVTPSRYIEHTRIRTLQEPTF